MSLFSNPVVDIAGWIGAAALLLAYWLVSAHRVSGGSRSYQALNAVGSVLLLANTAYYGAYPSSLVNVLWLMIAAWGLYRARIRAAGA